MLAWLILMSMFLLGEVTYHIFGFGLTMMEPLFAIGLIAIWGSILMFLISLFRGGLKKIVYIFVFCLVLIWYGAQIVYLRIFEQPLLWEAIFYGASDALTDFYAETIDGILKCLPVILLMLAFVITVAVLVCKNHIVLPETKKLPYKWMLPVFLLGIVLSSAVMFVGKAKQSEFYEEYSEFYDPYTIAGERGVLPLLQRDTVKIITGKLEAWGILEEDIDSFQEEEVVIIPEEEVVVPPEVEVPVYVPHQLNIDTEALTAKANGSKTKWLASYFATENCTYTNDYTGMFEGYNLIYLTAEGFSSYAIDKELTPTLYRLANSGFVFENYYVPLWQTSTSDGEYINCTGLIPAGQFSMRKSSSKTMPFTLPAYFELENTDSYAYHNNSLSYYDRYKTHKNLGYYFRASKRGGVSRSYEKDVFYMENPNAWPSSDLEMMISTVPEYIGLDRFHVYYMTISGHMNYTFSGNQMSAKNKEAVAHLDMSHEARAYLACNIELDKALESLLQQLEQAGKLEKTVICLTADHYPYGLDDAIYEELAGKDLSEGQDKFRNTLILWNAGMEETVYVDKVCGPMDVVPTLLNLFGFEYDSRVYAGKDILSEEEGMVIFNDRSFVTDYVVYNKRKNKTTWTKDIYGNDIVSEEKKDAYLESMKNEVKKRYDFSTYVIQENYYQTILEVLPPGIIAPATPVDCVPNVYQPLEE